MRSAVCARKRIASASSSGSAVARCRKAAIRLRRSRNTVTSSSAQARTITGIGASPQRPASAQLRDAPEHLGEEALLERAQQGVLVGEARVEAADRRAGAPRDLGHRGVGEALLEDQLLGRAEQALLRAFAAGLLRLAQIGSRFRIGF